MVEIFKFCLFLNLSKGKSKVFFWVLSLIVLLLCQDLRTEELQQEYFKPENILRFAEYLYQEGDYLRAAGEFERYLYCFDSFPEDADSILFKIGICYKKSKEYPKSITFFKKIIDLFPQSLHFSDSCYQIAHVYFLMGRNEESIKASDAYSPLIKSDEKRRKFKQLNTLNFIHQKKWDEAKSLLGSLNNKFGQESLSFLLGEAVEKGKNLPRKNRFLAGLMSAVVPGTGKIYTHRTLDGLVSMFTVAVTGWLSYKAFQKEGMNSTRGWAYGTMGAFFYLGNIYGSVVAVNIYNRELESKYFKGLEVTVNVYF
ncbi:MAG: tetratricopeptide repeat protein [Acidobacteriota bacterium]